MRKISEEKQKEILNLRLTGHSIPEISKITDIAKTTVTRYVKSIVIPQEYQQKLKEKQGGSKDRAKARRENSSEDAIELLGEMSERDQFLLLIGLYWGEGTKKDFSIVNSDPALIQSFITCLKDVFNIGSDRLSFSLRVHVDISIPNAISFWSKATNLPESSIIAIEIIEGKKNGKLPYGMCRVRVLSGIRERLILQSSISLIGKYADKRLVSS